MKKPSLIDSKTWTSVLELNNQFQIAFEIELESQGNILDDYNNSASQSSFAEWIDKVSKDESSFVNKIFDAAVIAQLACDSRINLSFAKYGMAILLPYSLACLEKFPKALTRIEYFLHQNALSGISGFLLKNTHIPVRLMTLFAEAGFKKECYSCNSSNCIHMSLSKKIRHFIYESCNNNSSINADDFIEFCREVSNEMLVDLNGIIINSDDGREFLNYLEYGECFSFVDQDPLDNCHHILLTRIKKLPSSCSLFSLQNYVFGHLSVIFSRWLTAICTNSSYNFFDRSLFMSKYLSKEHFLKSLAFSAMQEPMNFIFDEFSGIVNDAFDRFCSLNTNTIPEYVREIYEDSLSYAYDCENNQEESWKSALEDCLPDFWNKWGNCLELVSERSLYEDCGFEIKHKTCHKSLSEAVLFLEDFFADFDKQDYFEFNDRTGLHINISIVNKDGTVKSIINPLKGYLFLNESFIFAGNENSRGTKWAQHPNMNIDKVILEQEISSYTKFRKIENLLFSFLKKTFTSYGTKAIGFNFLNLWDPQEERRRIEFRFPGNTLSFQVLYRQLIYFCFIARHVYDPDFQRLRYIGKVFSFISSRIHTSRILSLRQKYVKGLASSS